MDSFSLTTTTTTTRAGKSDIYFVCVQPNQSMCASIRFDSTQLDKKAAAKRVFLSFCPIKQAESE
jgi:hypothetical protein